jgi:hypothetical protein
MAKKKKKEKVQMIPEDCVTWAIPLGTAIEIASEVFANIVSIEINPGNIVYTLEYFLDAELHRITLYDFQLYDLCSNEMIEEKSFPIGFHGQDK